MEPFKFSLRLFKFIFILYYGLFTLGKVIPQTTASKTIIEDDQDSSRIPIGVVFGQNTNQIQHAFKIAMHKHANNNTPDFLDFQVFVDLINTADSFKLSKLVCSQYSRGVISILASVHPDSFDTFHSYSNTFHMPLVTPFFPEKVLPPTSGLPDYALSIQPDFHKAVLGAVSYYGWQNVIYLYDSHDGMLRLQKLFKGMVPGQSSFFRVVNVKRIMNARDVILYLRLLEKYDRWSNKYLILDCSTTIAKETIIAHVRDVHLGRRNYHYLFTGLVLDERWDREIREYGSINITGFLMVDTSRKFVRDFYSTWKMDSIPAAGALMYDAAHVVLEAFQRILKQKPYIMENLMNKANHKYRFLNCDAQEAVPLKYGEEIADFIKKTQVEGLSGKIRFSSKGVRKNFSLLVVQSSPDGNMTKIATWYDDKGFRPVRKLKGMDVSSKYDHNKTYTVVSIQEPPFFMSSNLPKDPEDGTDIQYSGFCVELAEVIAEKLDIKIQFRQAADGKYGNPNPNVIGGWDGMVGELVRNEVDMVIAALTVTAEREEVIDYSMTYLSFNQLNAKTPIKETPQFAFLKPLSKEAWYLVGSSIVLVSIVMYVVSRFSPREWRVVAATNTAQAVDGSETPASKASVTNKFTFFNSVWFTISSFLQQGSEVNPRSISGRIVSAVWWFFTLMIVCSYTAFMASQLTLNGLETPMFPTYYRMTHCPEDMKDIIVEDDIHGTAEALGDTYTPQPKDYVRPVSNCQMIVTVLNPGVMDFAVAFPKGSKLRTGVNLALIAMRNDGGMKRLLRKHFNNINCVMPPVANGPRELTLQDIGGLFYMLIIAMAAGLLISMVEFCVYYCSGAAKANISIKTALLAKSRITLNEVQEEPQITARHHHRGEEDGWNGAETAPESYVGSPSGNESRTPMMIDEDKKACLSMKNKSSLQVMDQQQTRRNLNNRLRPIRVPLPVIQENPTSEIITLGSRQRPIAPKSLYASFEMSSGRSPLKPLRALGPRRIISRQRIQEIKQQMQEARDAFELASQPQPLHATSVLSSSRSQRNPQRALGLRHIITRQRSQQIMQQVQEARDAFELASQPKPYFTPTNQIGEEETAHRNSLTQV